MYTWLPGALIRFAPANEIEKLSEPEPLTCEKLPNLDLIITVLCQVSSQGGFRYLIIICHNYVIIYVMKRTFLKYEEADE